jgi:acyl carrier protein
LSSPLFEQVRIIAADLLGVPAEQITPASSPETLESWDSIQHLNLVLALEETFGVQLSPEEIEQMKNVGEIAKLLEAKLQAAPQ